MMQAMFVGRLMDIISHVLAGDLATARNLVANTPGIDWAQRLPPATYAAPRHDTAPPHWPPPATMEMLL